MYGDSLKCGTVCMIKIKYDINSLFSVNFTVKF